MIVHSDSRAIVAVMRADVRWHHWRPNEIAVDPMHGRSLRFWYRQARVAGCPPKFARELIWQALFAGAVGAKPQFNPHDGSMVS